MMKKIHESKFLRNHATIFDPAEHSASTCLWGLRFSQPEDKKIRHIWSTPVIIEMNPDSRENMV